MMAEVFAFLVLLVILAVVARSMIGLTQMATAQSTLAPGTRRLMHRLPMAIFVVWSIALFVRLYQQSAGYAMWPFELAIAVTVWLCWVAVIAAVVTLRDALLRLTRRAPDPGPEAGSDHG